ncbi:phenylalanine--tRNA ligase subunit alpha [Candidatus Micrarchaeota archaeon]|nr:phenylalanine--tRNA ligase subunit alpha [Candidatus Micrarchaeota archaeon]
MNESELIVLKVLEKHAEGIDSKELAKACKIDYNSAMSILGKLSEENLIDLKKSEKAFAVLTPEGAAYAENGLPEKKLADALKKGSIEISEIAKKANISPVESQIALQWARKNNWIKFSKDGTKTIIEIAGSIHETFEEKLLQKIHHEKRAEFENTTPFQNLKNRNLIEISIEKEAIAKITPEGKKAIQKPLEQTISQLTPQMLKDGKWKDVGFREYDLKGLLKMPQANLGKRQFYLQFVRELKEKLVGLGFKEANGPLTELEFWNMDALFMPQDHPARDIHDVFRLDLPQGSIGDAKLSANVGKAHEKGVDVSKGWGTKWNERMARRIVLRSQTTTVSARTLAAGVKPPLKMFCIGKVFRPDDIDWKHFLEFNQCDGIVVDENMSFRELLGYLKTFAVDIFGAKESDVKFAPSYFPFTEPSVELMVKINGKWTEAGGAGIFRPEMTRPLGVDVPVLAWGLGLDRLAMINLNLKDIRDLHSQDLQFLRNK